MFSKRSTKLRLIYQKEKNFAQAHLSSSSLTKAWHPHTKKTEKKKVYLSIPLNACIPKLLNIREVLLTKNRDGKPESTLQKFRPASVGRHLASWLLNWTQSSHGCQGPSPIRRMVSRQ